MPETQVLINDGSRRLNCLIEGESVVFAVTVGRDCVVSDLKKKINRERELDSLKDVDPHTLELWQVNIDLQTHSEHSLSELEPESLQGVEELTSWKSVEQYWSNQPLTTYLHIIVKVPATVPDDKRAHPSTLKVKRHRSPSADQEETKKHRVDVDRILPSEVDLKALHTRLQAINSNPELYSNPQNMNPFPFPFVFSILPMDRFDLSGPPESSFVYMGREYFSEVWREVIKLKTRGGFTQLYIHGTMGYGKSHILAVLAGLLSRSGKRTVYLPDCRQLVADMVSYLQSALLCAFASPSLSDWRDEIRALNSTDDVYNFCRKQSEPFYFIIDQMNALEIEDANMDALSNSAKETAQQFLNKLTSLGYRITSASSNYRTALHMEKRQTSERKVAMMGGMSEKEMKQWWHHHRDKVPIFEGDDKARVEDLTGRIPLLLRPLLQWGNRPFRDIEEGFLAHSDLFFVGKSVGEFGATKLKNETAVNYKRFYLSALANCLTGSSVIDFPAEWFDYRYFYRSEIMYGRYTCGLAREAAAIIIWKGSPGKLYDQQWIASLEAFANNPPVLGFMVEQACLSHICQTGFQHRGFTWGCLEATIFKGEIIPHTRVNEAFFVPDAHNFKDIDALSPS